MYQQTCVRQMRMILFVFEQLIITNNNENNNGMEGKESLRRKGDLSQVRKRLVTSTAMCTLFTFRSMTCGTTYSVISHIYISVYICLSLSLYIYIYTHVSAKQASGDWNIPLQSHGNVNARY
jgi:hypothetical protein